MGSIGAIIVGGYVNGLGLVRSFAARHIPVAVISTKPYDIAPSSRWVTAHEPLLDLDHAPDRLREVLDRRAQQWAGWAVLPTNDGAIAALVQHWDHLTRTYRIVSPAPDVAPGVLDKRRMLDAARAVRVDVPHCFGPADDATAGRADLHFPLVVKPVVGFRFFAEFGCKLFVANDREELRRCIARVRGANLAADVFDLVPGGDDEIYAYCAYIDSTGTPSAGVTIRKLRQSPPLFGVARAAEIVPDPAQLREASLAVAGRLELRGIMAAEFKRDPRDGRFRFLEVNGRSVIYNTLLQRGGLDCAALAWADQVEGRPAVAETNLWSGCWVNLHADLLYSLLRRRTEHVPLGAVASTYTRPILEAVWSPRDPKPFLAQWGRTLRQALAGRSQEHARESPLKRDLRDGTKRTLPDDVVVGGTRAVVSNTEPVER